MESKLDRFCLQILKLIKTFLFFILLFLAFRIVYIIRFGNPDDLVGFYDDLFRAILVGFRFDAQVIAYGLAGILLLNQVLLFVAFNTINEINVVFISVVFSVFSLLLILDQQFYAFFQNHFNDFAFGLLEDDTSAVLKSFWTDHPVIRIVIAWALISLVIYLVVKRIYWSRQTCLTNNTALRVLYALLFLVSFSFVMRGSFGEYPLQIDDSSVSENAFVNTVTVNGIFTLNAAAGERGKTFTKIDNVALLQRFGFNSLAEAFAVYYQIPVGEINKTDPDKYYYRQAAQNQTAKQSPPHVVVIVMESMNSHYQQFHSTELNLMGQLEKHWNQDIVFNTILSATNWTIGTLESMILSTPYQPITSTKYRFMPFKSSVAYTYKQAGYETSFVYGGKIGWRHMNEFAPAQYFDHAIGKSAIKKTIDGARENATWGIYDEYMFDYVYKKLADANQPQFMLVMSSTNHTPYELPDDYQPYNLNTLAVKNKSKATPEIIEKSLLAYQYANNSAGVFMDKLKSSGLADNTIIVITGDHNARELFSYDSNSPKMLRYGVPLYFYIPDKYQNNLRVDTSLFTAHKDIFPTLFSLSLSDKRYFGFGDNLFDPEMNKEEYYAINLYKTVYHPKADTSTLNTKARAISAIEHYYFNQFFDE